MAIYNIFESDKDDDNGAEMLTQGELFEHLEEFQEEEKASLKDRIMSTFFARLFFFLLLIADAVWGLYVALMFSISTLLVIATGGKWAPASRMQARYYLSLKRFLVCGLSLLVAIISPALGVMFACTYFLMYDKAGIDEIVPKILRAQFKEFFTPQM